MRYTWVDAGDDPDYAVGDRNLINGYYWPMFDAVTTRNNLNVCKGRQYAVGLYVVSNWPQFNGRTIDDIVKLIVAEYNRFVGDIPNLKLQLDAEEKFPDRILSILTGIRLALPHVSLSWTMEAGQAGWMNEPTFRDAVQALKVRVVPQCYNGAMTEVWDTWAYLKTLVDGGWEPARLSPFYDAKHLPHGWDGFAFTVGRLP